ncbi:uncharacterized protein EDB91DRAFT_1131459 [Suillus paluster]|uniref:uncharacterized protein n=1 Tax=Suillus paluster TaxID=48578 RepID=UPI001B85D60E|nr:uncharacterized protein EDB91DRAFT_1131459 [Suillus paluster]KAG1740790.1 hypothetical protein EDB91DRAFT_1131459 [Suillus paluster]
MGLIGVGKSTLINTAVENDVTPVGHYLQSCTQCIRHAICACPWDPSRRIVLVDTPGFDPRRRGTQIDTPSFDDTFIDVLEILRRTAVWLASSYDDDMKLAGVLYLYDISRPRTFGTSRKSLDMFRRLCSEDANVILVTAKWGDVDAKVGERREQQLKSSFWKEMIANGSQVARFDGSHKSAWDVMKPILANKAAADVRVQRRLVEFGRIIPEIDAGDTLHAALKEVAETQAVEGLKGWVGDADENWQRLKEIEKRLRELLKQIEELKVLLD